LIRFHKPYGVLSQFTTADDRPTLARFIDVPGVHCAGRLDFDSEGLLLLTDDGRLQSRIAHPKHKLEKVYLAQVVVDRRQPPDWPRTLAALLRGVELRDGLSRPTFAELLEEAPKLPSRDPPIPPHRATNSRWLRIGMTSGRNREVRRMLAAVGHPVLRLVRVRIGPFELGDLARGAYAIESVHLPVDQASSSHARRRR
jgi:23S rRNA pseudouridine2457 synthase